MSEELVYRRRWWILGVLCLSLMVITLDNTILNVALPTLVRDLGATDSQLQWIVDSYTLVFAGLLLTAGSLGDRFGRKAPCRSAWSCSQSVRPSRAFATDPNHLIVTRSLMGIGGAFIMPATLSILTNVFPAEERGGHRRVGGGNGARHRPGPAARRLPGRALQLARRVRLLTVNIPIAVVAIVSERSCSPAPRTRLHRGSTRSEQSCRSPGS